MMEPSLSPSAWPELPYGAWADTCTTNTGAYCQARARLPLTTTSPLARQVGELVAGGAPARWHWQGRRVRLVDGTTLRLADTP
jgi:hypothetical protein